MLDRRAGGPVNPNAQMLYFWPFEPSPTRKQNRDKRRLWVRKRPENGKFRAFGPVGIRKPMRRNPAPDGEFRQEKGAEDGPNPGGWWLNTELNPRPSSEQESVLKSPASILDHLAVFADIRRIGCEVA